MRFVALREGNKISLPLSPSHRDQMPAHSRLELFPLERTGHLIPPFSYACNACSEKNGDWELMVRSDFGIEGHFSGPMFELNFFYYFVF